MVSAIEADKPMPEADFQALRAELLRASAHVSCAQALDLADMLHAAIRMRKPCRKLRNLDDLFRGESPSFRAEAEMDTREIGGFGRGRTAPWDSPLAGQAPSRR